MKRLALALWSMMVLLFLGMGTAWAQDDMGGGGEMPALPETVTPPTFSPDLTTTTLKPGDAIKFGMDEAMENAMAQMSVVIYVVDGEDAALDFTETEAMALLMQDYESLTFSISAWDDISDFDPPYIAQKSGTIKARLVLLNMGAPEGDSEMPTVTFAISAIAKADFMVEGEAEKIPLPTFNPVAGEVEPQTKVTITSGYENDMSEDFEYRLVYVIDGTDADLTGSYVEMMQSGKVEGYSDPINIFKAQTIKARTLKMNTSGATVAMSDIATASYTVKGGDQEDKSVPKLTLSASEVTLPAAGQAVFSCTIDPQEYKGTVNNSSKQPNGLVGFAVQGTPGSIKLLEYQVGETINEIAWKAYPESDWTKYFAAGNPSPAYPANGAANDGRLLSIADGRPVTVHYRITMKFQEAACTAPTMKFAAVKTSAFNMWSNYEEDRIAEATVTFTVDESAKPATVAKPAFTPEAGEVEPNTVIEITSATPAAQIAYVIVKEGEADKTIDLTNPESYSLYRTPVPLRKAEGTTTVKALAFMQYDDDATKRIASELATAQYTFPKVAAPTFSPRGGLTEYGTVVNIYGSGDIYYTVDGSEPTTASVKYNSDNALHLDKIPSSAHEGGYLIVKEGDVIPIKAIAVVDGESSKVASETYTIRRGGIMTMTPDRAVVLKGEAFEFEVTLDPRDWRGASMYYAGQVDGYEAFDEFKYRKKGETAWTDLKAELDENEGTLEYKYSGTAGDITWEYVMKIKEETDVESIRLNIGYTPGSDRPFVALDKTFTVTTLAVPTFAPASGVVVSGTTVTLSTTEKDAEIRYTTDGTEPTAESPKYETPIEITTFTTVKAVTVKYGMCSKVAEAVYTLVAAPTFDPASGVVERNAKVTLATTTTDATIYYTTDGTEPTAQRTEYTTPITIDKPMTIKAIAINGTEKSLVAEASYVFVKAPVFSVAAGKVLQNTPLTLTAAEGAKIYYTTDGSEPTAQSTEYTAPIQLSRKMTVKAIAVVGAEVSFVAEAAYVITPIAPEFSIPAGAVEANTKVALTAVGDAEIRFSVIGTVTATSALYKNPITIDREKTISAAAFLDGEMSEIVTATYKVIVNNPVFTPAPGAVEKGTKVTIESGNASIRYTTDGTEPTDKNGRWYNPNAGIIIDEATTIKAYATIGSTKSETVTAIYTIKVEEPEKLEAPAFSNPAGEVAKGTNLTWTFNEDYLDQYDQVGVIYVAEGEDADLEMTAIEILQAYKDTPTDDTREDGTVYVYEDGDEVGYKINKDVTVKARLFGITLDPNYDPETDEDGEPGIEDMIAVFSDIVTASYTVTGGTTEPTDTIATPVITPGSGEVEKGTEVTITCATEGAYIVYTLDGSTPTMASNVYKKGEPIVINEALTLKAAATVQGKFSAVAEATYTIKTANEGLELAGVSVYPNPSDGEFTLDLPVSATVEVFASTGMLVQRLETGAGLMTLNIDRSGIYFLRITGEGRTTVKRVIVR